jgi:hypothetical protein
MDKLDQARIIDRAVLQQGSVDEGVQSAAVPVESDTRLKKIWVYADSVWSSHGLNDTHTIRIQTPAFDVTGWIDFLSHTRSNDQFITEVRVTMAHAANVLLYRAGITHQFASMRDLTNGLNYISGNHIEIMIQQTWSMDNFATPVPVAYQFIVESC